MSSRSFRLETRSRARDEIKRIMQTVEKVRKWEKKWIDLGLSNSLKVYKWVPVRDENKDEDSDDDNKENEPVALTEAKMEQNGNGEPDLPDINAGVPKPMEVDSSSLLATQAPPDVLLGSEEGEKKASPTTSSNTNSIDPAPPPQVEDAADSSKDSTQQKDGVGDSGSVTNQEELVGGDKEPCVENVKKTDDGHVSASSDSETVEAMETGGDEVGKGGDNEPSVAVSDACESESQQPTSTDGTSNSDIATTEPGDTMRDTAQEPQENKESAPEKEAKRQSESAEAAPEDANETVPPSQVHGEDSVITEPATMDEKAKPEVKEAPQEQQQQTEDDEKRAEKREREGSSETKSSPPPPKRSRSTSPQ